MGQFTDDFRDVFPKRGEKLYLALEPRNAHEDALLALKHLPPVALLHSVEQAVERAHYDVPQHAEFDAYSAISALVAIADSAIARSTNARELTREIVGLLDTVATLKPEVRELVDGYAAVIHARARDELLASARLKRLRASPYPPIPTWWYDMGLPGRLVSLADELIGSQPWRPTTEPSAIIWPDLRPIESAVWDQLLSAGGAGLELDERITSWALADADAAYRSLVHALIHVPRIIGFSAALANAASSMLARAEEVLWLSGAPRGPSWSLLALAAASLHDAERARRGYDYAFAALLDPNAGHREQLEIAANLLNAEALLRSEAAPTPALGPAGRSSATVLAHTEEPLPAQLGATLAAGDLLVIAGPNLPTARGAPGRTDLLRHLVETTEDLPINDAGRRRVLAGLAQANLDEVARVFARQPELLRNAIIEAYAAPPANSVYAQLAAIPCAGVVNMSWDAAVLEAYRPRSPTVIGAGSEAVLTAAKSQDFTFTWFGGDPEHERIPIGSREVRYRINSDDTLTRYLTGIVQSSSLLFVGVRTSDVLDFFEALPTTAGMDSSAMLPVQHRYAVCVRDELWDLNRGLLQDLYGVELIGYDPVRKGELARIIGRLAALAAGTESNARSAPGAVRGPVLNRITLTNIGAFASLDIELTDGWNLLLGNNGCGKSTILRAVALGLCGDHPLAVEAGQTLLRAGTDSGVIELLVGGSRYRTELQRLSGTVRVYTSSLTPVQQGSWAVLGFPALRGMSLTTLSGISHPQVPEPQVEDLLPLLRNEVDHRLDDIKQWIINVEARSRVTGDERDRQLLDRFFGVLAELTPGTDLAFDTVDMATWQVRVRTDDGIVAIDQLSQGMNSIIAWVGTLLQRMYDIYPDRPEPADEVAFVLIDELDAHLHPAWQRLVPSLTRKHFPQVQYLATSHSPLVASSLASGELFVAMREPQLDAAGTEHLVATVERVDIDAQGLRADQILTSPLFGLMTSRSPEFGERVDRYSELMTAPSRTPDEEAEMLALRRNIALAYSDGETQAQRDAERAAAPDIDVALANAHPSEQTIDRLRGLLDNLGVDPAGEQS